MAGLFRVPLPAILGVSGGRCFDNSKLGTSPDSVACRPPTIINPAPSQVVTLPATAIQGRRHRRVDSRDRPCFVPYAPSALSHLLVEKHLFPASHLLQVCALPLRRYWRLPPSVGRFPTVQGWKSHRGIHRFTIQPLPAGASRGGKHYPDKPPHLSLPFSFPQKNFVLFIARRGYRNHSSLLSRSCNCNVRSFVGWRCLADLFNAKPSWYAALTCLTPDKRRTRRSCKRTISRAFLRPLPLSITSLGEAPFRDNVATTPRSDLLLRLP